LAESRKPRLAFRSLDEEPWREVKAQMHGDKRVSIWEKYLEWTEERLVLYAKYDPNIVVERHSHMSDHVVFVIEGEIDVGGRHCPAGTNIMLEKGAVFGPIIGGPKGALMLEIMMGDPRAVPADKAGFEKLCAERGVVPLPNPPLDMPAWAWFGKRLD
jgi:hypothetical protein